MKYSSFIVTADPICPVYGLPSPAGPVTEAVTVRVGHVQTILPLPTLLGFPKESDALTSIDYGTKRERSFRTSHMLPYAANLLLTVWEAT